MVIILSLGINIINIVCLFCLIVFTSDYQTFCNLFKVRGHFIGCINHDIVIGLCSELLVGLIYYIHPGYGKKCMVSHADRTWVLPNVIRQLYPCTRALTLLRLISLFYYFLLRSSYRFTFYQNTAQLSVK